ncbi:MAG: hypothetical protein EPN91_07910 [Salinibacterium sp.]|nr:MAG: hypothetical protein EPN91_07910 [Salinibacterium sp.]
MPMDDDDQARVEVIDGQLVLIDPVAAAVAKAVDDHNKKAGLAWCRELYTQNAERIAHFAGRAKVLGRGGGDIVIVILVVDDRFGGPLASQLMPGHDWQAYRDRGEAPIARGLAERGGIEDALGMINADARHRLLSMTELAVVVVAGETADVFAAVP